MELVAGNYSIAENEVDNATQLLEEAQLAINAANGALQVRISLPGLCMLILEESIPPNN